MSATVEDLRASLRERAVKKRTQMADTVPAQVDFASVLVQLNTVLGELRDVLKARSPSTFTVTERDLNGDIRAFKVGE